MVDLNTAEWRFPGSRFSFFLTLATSPMVHLPSHPSPQLHPPSSTGNGKGASSTSNGTCHLVDVIVEMLFIQFPTLARLTSGSLAKNGRVSGILQGVTSFSVQVLMLFFVKIRKNYLNGLLSIEKNTILSKLSTRKLRNAKINISCLLAEKMICKLCLFKLCHELCSSKHL